MLYAGGLQVVGAPLARQSSAASGKPSRLAGTARRPRTRRRRNSIARAGRNSDIPSFARTVEISLFYGGFF